MLDVEPVGFEVEAVECAVPAVPVGPRIRRRETWVELPVEYEGFRFRLWINAPTQLWMDILSGEEVKSGAALRQVVLEHNGWLDFEGQPYAPTGDAEFWNQIPTELATTILMACRVEMGKLPNSLTPTKRR